MNSLERGDLVVQASDICSSMLRTTESGSTPRQCSALGNIDRSRDRRFLWLVIAPTKVSGETSSPRDEGLGRSKRAALLI